ncbi:MAG: hypothetical protein Q9224_006341, partial [Gallowayella concinna]
MNLIPLYLFFAVTYCFEGSLNDEKSLSLEQRDPNNSGNYSILHCSTNPRSSRIIDLLPQVFQSIQLVLRDLDHGTASRHGYRTFFKTNTHLPLVKKVFQDMAQGRKLNYTNPLITCLNPYNESPTESSADSMMCGLSQPGHKMIGAAAFPTSGLLIICPHFWTSPTFPRAGVDTCPLVTYGDRRHRRFAEDGRALMNTQFALLVRELARLYNPLMRGPAEEVDGAQECLELDAENSIRNAGNWALYAA